MGNGACTVRVYGRESCYLCDELVAHLDTLSRRYEFDLVKIDIGPDPGLMRLHGERVPVVEINGKEIGWGRIPPGIVEQHLAQAARPR